MRLLRICWALLAFGCSSARTIPSDSPPPATTAPKPPEPPNLRLGESARPRRYALDLIIVPSEDEFSGKIEIDLELREPKALLWLNGTEIEIHRATIRVGTQSIGALAVPGNKDFVGLAFEHPVPAGPALLSIEYAGKLSRRESTGLFCNISRLTLSGKSSLSTMPRRKRRYPGSNSGQSSVMKTRRT